MNYINLHQHNLLNIFINYKIMDYVLVKYSHLKNVHPYSIIKSILYSHNFIKSIIIDLKINLKNLKNFSKLKHLPMSPSMIQYHQSLSFKQLI